MKFRSWQLGFAALGLSALLSAQQAPPAGDPGAAPGSAQGVARVSLISGDVSTQRADSGEWSAAGINQPLVNGDQIATAAGARGEIQLDFADVLRLDGNSVATLANLSPNQLQMQVAQGTVEFAVLPGATAETEIDTPNLALKPHGAGIFRVQVNSDSETVVIVRQGQAEISVPEGSTDVLAGQMITVQGAQDAQYQTADAPAPDQFDEWNQNRDNAMLNARSRRSANPYYTGVSDLDGYGHWAVMPGYGQVWVPDGMSPGWAPYSAGRWVWEPTYGWTWVSLEPWGWAPYHYGRWFMMGASWAWWPGPVTPMYRPIWAPAYVSFVGFHAGPVAVGVGFGTMGWVPLGPADPFHPWFGGVGVRVVEPLAFGPRYTVVYSNVNLVERDPRFVIAVPADRFGQGVVVRQTMTVEQVRTMTVVRGEVPVVPTRASLVVGDRVVNTAVLPHAAVVGPARFYGTHPVPAPRPSFEQQQREVATRLGPGAVRPAESRPAAAAGERPAARPPQPAGNGWHSFGANAGTSAPRPAEAAPNGARSEQTTPRPAEATPDPARGTTTAQPAGKPAAAASKDGQWHSFNNKKAPPPPKKDDGRGGGVR